MSRDRYRAVSSAYGRIEEILLTHPGSNSGKKLSVEGVQSRYSGIWNALENRVTCFVFGNFEDQALFDLVGRDYQMARERFRPSHKCRVVPIVADMQEGASMDSARTHVAESGGLPRRLLSPNRIFAQDPFVILMDGYGNRSFLESYHFKRGGDRDIAEQVSAQTDFRIKATRYSLEGGNILIGNDYAIVGADTLQKNLEIYFQHYQKRSERRKHPEKPAMLLKEHLKEILGVDYLIVPELERPVDIEWDAIFQGSGKQALYHLDMYLTLGGPNGKGKETIYVAELKTGQDGISYIRGESYFQNEDPLMLEVEKLSDALNQTAAFFEDFGKNNFGPSFDVQRLPMEMICEGVDYPVLRSYNNCLVEVYDQVKRIFLPQFKDHKSQMAIKSSVIRRVRNRLASHGFEVVWVEGDFDDLAEKGAGLHCIVKVLKRRKPHFI